jgi:murein L,D-transpeptidase YafK
MNPNSNYYLSFDTGFPNAYDQQLGRTGSLLMVHGSCSSAGCFAMTDESIAEIYAIAREAFAGGQRGFQFQSYPFRMTAENLAKHRLDPNIAFWKNLKEGNDTFEVTREEPQVGVGNGRYVFNAGDASAATAVAQKQQRDEQQVAALVARGVQPVRLVYADGGQNRVFREALSGGAAGEDGSLAIDTGTRNRLGDVSRPEALAAGPREILLNANGNPRRGSPTDASYASQKAYH